jgi:hypothetical protein
MWLQSDYRKNCLEQRQRKNGGRDAKLLMLLPGNLWAQARSQYYLAKMVLICLLLKGVGICGALFEYVN